MLALLYWRPRWGVKDFDGSKSELAVAGAGAVCGVYAPLARFAIAGHPTRGWPCWRVVSFGALALAFIMVLADAELTLSALQLAGLARLGQSGGDRVLHG